METEIRINPETGNPEFVVNIPHQNPRVRTFKTIENAVVYARAFVDGVTEARNMCVIIKQWQITPELSEALRNGK